MLGEEVQCKIVISGLQHWGMQELTKTGPEEQVGERRGWLWDEVNVGGSEGNRGAKSAG